MASRLDLFQAFVLTFQSPWNLAGAGFHNWHHTIYVTGTVTHNAADAEAAALDLAKPALALASSKTSLVAWVYYPSGSLVNTQGKNYAAGTHPGNGSAYAAGSAQAQQLEVAAVAHAPIGKNTKGKEIYLRHYFHEIVAEAGDTNALPTLNDPTTLLAPWNTGSGPHAVVPCSPRSGNTGVWTVEPHLFTHQLRKGKKRKLVASGTGSSTLDQLIKGVGTAAAVKALLELTPLLP